MQTTGLAETKAQLSAQLDAGEAGEAMVITRLSQSVTRRMRERPASIRDHVWLSCLRAPHGQPPDPARSALDPMRQLRGPQP